MVTIVTTSLMAPRLSLSQSVPAGIRTDTLRVAAPPGGAGGEVPPAVLLDAGERVAIWTAGATYIERVEAGRGPVAEASVGEAIARFGSSGWFALPQHPFVWTAPQPGELNFAVNAYPQHKLSGEVAVILVRLGPRGSTVQDAFEPPLLAIERDSGGARVRYTDRAGFGLDLKSLSFTVKTADGPEYRMAAWAEPGPEAIMLPLPPPGIELAPGVHSISVTITDWLGNSSPPASMVFDTSR